MDKDQVKNSEKETSHGERRDIEPEKTKQESERPQISAEDRERIKEELRREIELMEQDPGLKQEIENKAKRIGSLALDKIFEHLFEIIEEKGGIDNPKAVAFAVGVAKRINDPYILDTFHDILAEKKIKR